MIRSIDWKQTRETPDAQRAAGRHNPAFVAAFRDGTKRRRITLGAGEGDTVRIYRANGVVYVITLRRALRYCGVEAYRDGAPMGEVSLQHEWEIAEVLGRNERDYDALSRLTDHAIAARLIAYADERFY